MLIKIQTIFRVDYWFERLFSTISTRHKNNDYRFQFMESWIRDSFESGEIYFNQLIVGKHSSADALTKRNLSLYRILNDTMIHESILSLVFGQAKRAKFASQIS